jgi:dienelactone hydrolase
MLIEQGASCAIVETSRIRRDRESFGEDREAWAHAAFKGKTFFQDHADAVAGIEAAAMEAGIGSIWVFGFSLGGIHAVLAAGSEGLSFTPSGIALGGSGYRIRSEAENALTLPILDSMPGSDPLIEAAGRLRAERLVSSTVRWTPHSRMTPVADWWSWHPCPEKKGFVVIEGADHAFRSLKGNPSLKPLEMISSFLTLSF